MSKEEIKQLGLAIIGAIAGGVLGYFTFFWLTHQGFYGMIVPGSFIGLGASLGRTRHMAFAVVCAIAALALGIFCEWQRAPFRVNPQTGADASLGYFVTHLHKLDSQVPLIMIVAGAALAFWFPYRRRPR